MCAVRASVIAVAVAAGACGRVDFATGRDGGGASNDGALDAAGPAALSDFSSAVPYNPQAFLDDDGSFQTSGPTGITAVTAPFEPGFAVTCGRAVVMVGLDGSVVVHDYTPAAAGTNGPDELVGLVAGTQSGSGSGLWLAGESQLDGDGLFALDASFAITRDNANNNVSAVAFDPAGAFDAVGAPSLYFASGNVGVVRRTGPGDGTTIMASSRTLGSLGVTPAGVYVVDFDDPDAQIRIDYVVPDTHAVTYADDVPTAVVFASDDAAVGSAGILALRDPQHLAVYQPDGSFADVATNAEPGAQWLAASVPRAPHPLAGRTIVVELTPATGRERLLVLPP